MSNFNMSKRLYADRKAPDGVVCSGWRRVRKGGWVKIGGSKYFADQLNGIVGELVLVRMGDYWMQSVGVFRGAYGCSRWFCDASVKKN